MKEHREVVCMYTKFYTHKDTKRERDRKDIVALLHLISRAFIVFASAILRVLLFLILQTFVLQLLLLDEPARRTAIVECIVHDIILRTVSYCTLFTICLVALLSQWMLQICTVSCLIVVMVTPIVGCSVVASIDSILVSRSDPERLCDGCVGSIHSLVDGDVAVCHAHNRECVCVCVYEEKRRSNCVVCV